MKLQGRNLSINTRGEDVRRLHNDLSQLGYAIPDDEREGAVFGSVTHRTIMEFQRRHNLEMTGIVDERVVIAINVEIENGEERHRDDDDHLNGRHHRLC